MKKFYIISTLCVFVLGFSMCHKADSLPGDQFDDRLSGGSCTVFDISSQAFKQSMSDLSARQQQVHDKGDAIFDQVFVAPPAKLFGGLGPVFNNISCINCHRGDGQGFPTFGGSNSGMLMRISIPGEDEHGGPLAAPGFGVQLQDQAVLGATPEVRLNIAYSDVPVVYPDGSVTTLRKPAYTLSNAYTTLPGNYLLSPRLAPKLVGMGLLENIPEQTILSFVDAGDKNGDGITGKANYVYDPYTKRKELGRFGVKANTSTIALQVASAYQQDMGVTSYITPVESALGQTQMGAVPGTDVGTELVDSILNYVTYYVQTLSVPARRDVLDADNKRGEVLFTQLNCGACHRATIQTAANASIGLRSERIHPYTDMLLHDMGDDLADNRPDYLATGREWRTSPLWGLGLLVKTNANGVAYYLHDGRARTMEEAILWHGGEAQQSKEGFMQLSKDDRGRLVKFLQSL
ncbi:di-heme oxidoreductase family protein [Deminuibacter soli]|uniref:Thiol oxidoreductase n=1 Tax=Deminuibacter soli TaxID=2291815 RepID=A0A3E1NP85_9BACT|nr:di-heme oxidoredictase family protein [Deminuibacter soli]RFM29746.1 thiol oxidoreductase [Deminuibacter soli]